jgi:hypothetical protein
MLAVDTRTLTLLVLLKFRAALATSEPRLAMTEVWLAAMFA